MLHFNEDTGFYVDEVGDVRADVAAAWTAAFAREGEPPLNTEPETPAGQLIDSQTAAVAEKDSELLYLCNMFDPKRSTGVFQDCLGQIYFLTRKGAVPSQATVTVTGLPGTVIPVAAQIRSVTDDTLWSCTEQVTIPAEGTTTTVFACMTPGAISAAAGTLTRIVTVVAGWDTAVNNTAAAVGNPAESRGAFESRRYASVALNSRSTASAIYARVLQIPDVVSCYVTQNRTSAVQVVDGYILKPHSVYVAVVGGDDDDIARALYDTVSAGCDYNGNTEVEITDPNTGAAEIVAFNRPAEMDVYLRVTLVTDTALTAQQTAQIKQALYNNFYGLDSSIVLDDQPIPRVTMNTVIYASRFPVSLYNLGYSNVLEVKVRKSEDDPWTDSIRATLNDDPVLLTDNITIIVEGV